MIHQVNLDTPQAQPQQPGGANPSQPDPKRDLAVIVAAIRKDAAASVASADGNWSALTVNRLGGLRVDPSNAQLFNADPTALTHDKPGERQRDEIVQLLTEIRDILQERLY